jgi:hypothetical protein
MTVTQFPPVRQISLSKRFSVRPAPASSAKVNFAPWPISASDGGGDNAGAAPARWAHAIGTRYSSNAALVTYCRGCVLL